jgi:hypothetical protein
LTTLAFPLLFRLASFHEEGVFPCAVQLNAHGAMLIITAGQRRRKLVLQFSQTNSSPAVNKEETGVLRDDAIV